MVTLEPTFVVCQLHQIRPSDLVLCGAGFGFGGFSSNAPRDLRVVAQYDDALSQFVHVHDVPHTYVSFASNTVVITPDFESFSEGIHVGINSTSELVLNHGSPSVVMHLGREARLFDLKTGQFGAAPLLGNMNMSGFTRWRVGVRLADNSLQVMKKFSHRSG